MNMRKKLLSLVMAIAILCVTSVPAFASSTFNCKDDNVEEKMLKLLLSIEHEKEMYGLGSVDFSSVTIGEGIPTYKVKDGTLALADISFIPILSGGEVVSLFYVADIPNIGVYVQLSCELVESLKQFSDNTDIAIIYDDTGAYVYKSDKLSRLTYAEKSIIPYERYVEITTNPVSKEEYDILTEATPKNLIESIQKKDLNAVQKGGIASKKTINIKGYSQSEASIARSTSKYLSVDIIKQPRNTHICWAIAITSIANYLFNDTWQYESIVNMFNGGIDQGMSTPDAIQNFNEWFNADYGYSYAANISKSFILNQLVAGYPLFGGFCRGNDNYHAVVIRGINTAANTFSVMNTSPTTTGYTAGTISSSGELSFISANSGYTYSLYNAGHYLYVD